MADTTLSIGVIAELADFRKAMETLPGIGEKEARDMVTGIRKQLKLAESAGKSSAAGISKGFSGEFNKISSAAATMAAQVGGPFAQLASVANSALKPIAEVGSGLEGMAGNVALVGGLTGAAVAGIAAVTFSAKMLADAAVEAEKNLDKMGVAISGENHAALAAYKAATADLSVAFDELKVAVGAELAGDLAVLASAAAGAVRSFIAWRDSMTEIRATIERWADIISTIASLGLLPELKDQVEDFAAANQAATVAVDGLSAAMIFGLSVAERKALIDEQTRLDKAKDAKAAAAAAKELAKLDSEAAARAFQAGQAAEAQQIEDDQRADQQVANSQRVNDQIAADSQNEIDQVEEYRDAYVAAQRAIQAASEASRQKLIEDSLATADIALSSASSIIGGLEQLQAARIQSAMDNESTTRAYIKQEFKRQQEYAIAQAIMSAAQAAMGMTAAMAYLGPFAPVVAGGLAAAELGIQLGIIKHQKPPEFPTGMSPDHFPVGIQRGEGIASRRAMADPAVKQALENGNQGVRQSAQGPQQVQVTVRRDPRLRRLVVDTDTRTGKRSRRGR